MHPRAGEYTLRVDDILEVLEREGPTIALVLFPGVQYLTGQLFPIERITQAAQAQVRISLFFFVFLYSEILYADMYFGMVWYDVVCVCVFSIRVVYAPGTLRMRWVTSHFRCTIGTSTLLYGAPTSISTPVRVRSVDSSYTTNGPTRLHPGVCIHSRFPLHSELFYN